MSPSNQTTPTLLEKYPIFLAGRSRMITEKDSLSCLKELETLLIEQLYTERITKLYKYPPQKKKKKLRNIKEQEKLKVLPFILTFNPAISKNVVYY